MDHLYFVVTLNYHTSFIMRREGTIRINETYFGGYRKRNSNESILRVPFLSEEEEHVTVEN